MTKTRNYRVKSAGKITESSMKEYGLYVLEERALADIRDGLKPVQRRILWSVWDRLKLRPNSTPKKSARVTGETNGCFTGDTVVPLLNGKGATFEQLTKKKRPFWVYSESNGKIVPGLAHHPRITRYVKKIAKVTLDSGVEIRCTLDHEWLLLDGTYVAAKDLKHGDSLMPLVREIDSGIWGSYEKVKHPWKGTSCTSYSPGGWDYTHRMVANYFGILKQGDVVHHSDGNKRNNSLENLVSIPPSKHVLEHLDGDWYATVVEVSRRKDVRDKKSKGVSRYWSSDRSNGHREINRKWGHKNKKHVIEYTQTQEHRDSKSSQMSSFNKDPDFQKKAFSGKILKLAKSILDDNGALNETTWEYYRQGKHGTIRFQRAVEEFGSVKKLEKAARSYKNDTVVKVQIVKYKKPIPMYDLTVEGTHNFAIKTKGRNGVIVHNSLHPHGDCYQTLVNMTWVNHALLEGVGNFGDPVANKPAAASRYTSVRATDLLAEVFRDSPVTQLKLNYSGEIQEPVVLPSRVPTLLASGSEGIGVGVTSCIPPHNLKELSSALLLILRKPTTRLSTLLKYVKGPDYREGGVLVSDSAKIKQVYQDGTGSLSFQCQQRIDKVKNGYQMVITSGAPNWSMPRFIDRCEKLVSENLIGWVSNESGENIRVVVFAKDRKRLTEKVIPLLSTNVRYNWVALDGKTPIKFNLVDYLTRWLDFRRGVVEAHLNHKLAVLKKRLLEEEAKLAAVKNLDDTIKALRSTKPITNLKSVLNITTYQAKVILRSSIKLLTKLGEKKQDQLVKDLRVQRTKLLKDLKNIDGVVAEEIKALAKYSLPRATQTK